MMTWFSAWPLAASPFFIISLVSAIPTFVYKGGTLGGLPIREWILDHLLLPVLPAAIEDRILDWFSHASYLEEWLLVAFVAININAALLPLLYYLVGGLIRINNYLTRKSYEAKQSAVR